MKNFGKKFLNVLGYVISSIILGVVYTIGNGKLKKIFKMEDEEKKEI